MKTTFFAAALVALLSSTQAAVLNSQPASEAAIQVDACHEMKNGIIITLDKPECKEEEKKVPFEQAMLGALGELSTKSNELAKALSMEYTKNKKLECQNTQVVSGRLEISPAGPGPDPSKK